MKVNRVKVAFSVLLYPPTPPPAKCASTLVDSGTPCSPEPGARRLRSGLSGQRHLRSADAGVRAPGGLQGCRAPGP